MNKIIETCKFVAQNSQHVKINYEKINDFCNYFHNNRIKQ
jgi:hypothetical protein